MSVEFKAEPNPSQELCAAVAAFRPTNPFYTPSYLEARRWLGFEPWVLMLRRDGRLASACTAFMRSGYLNRSLEITSLPAVPDRDAFWEGLMEFCHKARVSHLDIHSFGSAEAFIPAIPGEIVRRTRCEHVLDLRRPGLWHQLSTNHLRNIKRARDAGLQVRRAADEEACQFHARLVGASLDRRTSRGESIPKSLQTQSFVAMTRSGAGELFQAVLNGKPVSSILVLVADKGGYYHSAGTSPEGMACGASHFLVYETSNILQAESRELFNLGGGEQSNPGLERFKAGFGGAPVKLESAEFFLGSAIKKTIGMAAQLLCGSLTHLRDYRGAATAIAHAKSRTRILRGGDDTAGKPAAWRFRTRPVLILGAEPRVTVTIARSLHRLGVPVTAAALSPQEPRLSSHAIAHFVRIHGHPQSPQDFIEAITALIHRDQFDMLIPSSDRALTLVAQHYEKLSTLLHVCSPPPHIVERVLDKTATLEVAKQCGIPVPPAYCASDLAGLEALRETIRFPTIAKPRRKQDFGMSSFKIRYFVTFGQLRDAFSADPTFGQHNLLQEYCGGEGVLIATLIVRGQPIGIFQHRRLKELPAGGGVSVLAVSELPDPTLTRFALTLLRALEWEGIALVEFRYDRTNRTAVLMEVNGRYWGTLSLAVQAGMDFPAYQWKLAHGESPTVPSAYSVGMRWRWTSGDLVRLHSLFTHPRSEGFPRSSRLREVARFLMDFKFSTRPALWSMADPVPALSELSRTVKDLAVADAKAIMRRLVPRWIINQVRAYWKLLIHEG